jgi:nitrogenase molybdenum-iron protein alpha/beta subunit
VDERKKLLDRLAREQEGPDFSQRVTFTYMIGVYLAVNAISDLYLLVEGPDCSYMKTQYVQGNHDWMSTLTSVSGFHRVANTALHPAHMSGSREEGVQDALLRIARSDAVPAVALTSMPMAFITGADYDRLTHFVREATGKAAIHIPGKSLSGDWLDGYAETILSLASQLDLSGGRRDDRKVGIVGYLFDRNEEDHAGNLRELERMFGALDLELVSVWLSGGRFEDLYRIRDAGTILSLPYGRKAAKKLAKRTGARLVEMPLPFGLGASEAFTRRLGELWGRERQADSFVDKELSRVVPKLEWLIPFLFQNRNIAFLGEPHVLPGLAEIVRMLGADLSYAVVTNRPLHAKTLESCLPDTKLLLYPKMKEMMRFVTREALERELHLLVTNNMGIMGAEGAILEFGFPSAFRHALYDRPFLGFSGTLSFVDSMANAMRMYEVELARRNMLTGLVRGPMSGH